MKKLILIIIAVFFTTAAYSHSTKFNYDNKKECRKSRSLLNWVSKNKYYKGGELIKYQSYTGFDQRTVIIGGHKKNPIEITGYLQLPKGDSKVPIVIWTHSSGGPGNYIWNDFTYHAHQKLLEEGIGVMFIDNFCPRGAKDTWRDQSKVPLINGAIDGILALKLLKSHPRSNGKFGTTGHSRGGNNSLYMADVKFTSIFLDGTEGFDAILPEAAECHAAGFFAEPELTTNTKLLYVHGGADDYTLAKPCEEHVKRIKAKPGQVEIDIKEGWYHEWHAGKKPFKVKGAMTTENCPDFFIDEKGIATNPMWEEWFIKKHKLYPSLEAYYEAAQTEPRKLWKKSFKIMKKEKCLSKGVTIGGDHIDEYMPQFINFFKENLL